MNNLEEINNKYKLKISSLIDSYIYQCFDALALVEDYFYKDKVKINIESRERITYNDVIFYFDSFFEADNLESFALVLEKLGEVIKKYRLKSSLDEINSDFQLDYEYLENAVTSQIFDLINKNLESSKRASLSSLSESDSSSYYSEAPHMDGYIGFERFDELVDLVLDMLPTLKDVADKYGLASIQDVEFSRTRYLALEDCFEKIEFTKKVTPDIGKICDALVEAEDIDLNDILSEEYARYTLIVLEAAHFVAHFYTSGKSDRKAAEKHKNESNRIGAIRMDIDYYLDLIDFNAGGYDFVSPYPRIQKIVNDFNKKEFADKLINELGKKAKKL